MEEEPDQLDIPDNIGGGLTTSTDVGSLASTFRSTRNTAKTGDELRQARESRAMEALRMKDEQLRILSQQNASLLKSLDKVEEDANAIQIEKLAVEQENRNVRDNNFELQSKARAAETQAKRMAAEVADMEKQLRMMTDQNTELLRLLQSEEMLTSELQTEISEVRSELDEIRSKYGALLTTAKSHEELATKAAREGQLRAEEIRLLRAETEQLKQVNAELKMKTQVEVEALQEQLRVRKEKQYQLLEKLQAQEEAKRQAEDQVAGMEEQLRGLHSRSVELDTQLQVEIRSKQNLEEVNKELQTENANLFGQNKELQLKIEKSEKERLRMEAEARDSGSQLRDMAEKVFQLLERLKLAELGKTKAMEALKKKEQDMVALQKKNARLIKETTEEGRARVKAELDVKVLQEQVRTLKKSNNSLAQRSKDEATEKVAAQEECEKLKETLKTTESRLSFLLNKVQQDEEARIVQLEDRKKLESQVINYNEKCEELNHKLTEIGESNRVITQAMRLKQEELNALSVKYEAVVKELEMRENQEIQTEANGNVPDLTGAKAGAPDDVENVRLNEGRGRFYIEAKTVGGGSLLLLRGRKPLYKDWLEKHAVNDFLKRAQKTQRFRDMVVERLAMSYGLLMVEEEEKDRLLSELSARDKQIDHLQRKLSFVQDAIATEEDAKRRMLLRYIQAVKDNAMTMTGGIGGVLQLPESNINDEEVHALAALLRNSTCIDEVNLRNNNISDDGARALGAVLAGRTSIRLIDLRGNKIGKGAIRVLAEALERSERVRHVYVHAGGKIEALGAGRWSGTSSSTGGPSSTAKSLTGTVDYRDIEMEGGTTAPQDPRLMVTVETICVVDVRDNQPQELAPSHELQVLRDTMEQGRTNGGGPTDPRAKSPARNEGTGVSSFSPIKLLNSVQAPPKGAVSAMSPPLKPKRLKKTSPIVSKSSSQLIRPLDESKKEGNNRARDDIVLSIKETAWQGRAAGFDRPLGSLDSEGSIGFGSEKDSIRLRGNKNLQRGELPPLVENSGNRPSSSQRVGSASRSAEETMQALALEALNKARGKAKRNKKHSETEKKLLNSPFARPF